mgnify:FL=1
MTLQKIEFMCDIPDGYRFVRYGEPKTKEKFINNGVICTAKNILYGDKIIVEKIPEQEQPKLKLQYKTQQGDWRDVIDGYEYRIKPKTKTIRFRNWYHTNGRVYASHSQCEENGPDFVKWLGDWQEVEVEE